LSNSERLAVSSAKQIIKRAATPEEIANAIVYIGSPAAAFITGQIFFVDGG
jgi:NAD(P)-dependent dehydrogenase (short-subunit alcohol dehydrogenase family)